MSTKVSLIGFFAILVGLPLTYGQDLLKKEALDKLLDIEERFSQIRENCCVLIEGEMTGDDPNLPLPNTVQISVIYASSKKAQAVRQDFGFGGSVFEPRTPGMWIWNRTLKVKGKKEVRLQGNSSGGNDGDKVPLFFQMFDPLCLCAAAFGDMSTGAVDAAWLSRMFIANELATCESEKNGDLVATVVTAKNRTAGGSIRLSRNNGFMPTEVNWYRNSAAEPLKEFKPGKVFTKTTTEWKKRGEVYLPTSVIIDSPNEPDGGKHYCQYIFHWAEDGYREELLFDEATMRSRWDSIESLWADLHAKDK